MTETGCSVLVITRDRNTHLANVLKGLSSQSTAPSEVVVVYMNQPEHLLPETDLPLRALDVTSDEPLPLARARSTAARAARHDVLLFLDVDCIPHARYIETMMDDVARYGGLVMAEPFYLPEGETDFETARPHPGRDSLTYGTQSAYGPFWSLCFGMSKADYERSGGFDEDFTGYGAEDTDLAWSCRAKGIPFSISEARAYHQFHTGYAPPIQHLQDIVRNAQVFFRKWDEWPMGGWLEKFEAMGLIQWKPDEGVISVLRSPTEAEYRAALK